MRQKCWAAVVTVALGSALATVFATSAFGHSCAVPVHIVRDRDTQVNVGVTVGDTAVHNVKIEFSPSITAKQALPQRGWTASQPDARTVVYDGGTLDPNSCVTFPIVIHSGVTGSFGVRALETQEDGTVVEHPADGDIIAQPDGPNIVVDHAGPPNPLFEEVVYVDGKDSGAPTGIIVIAGGGLAALVAIGYFMFGRRPAAAPARAAPQRRRNRR